MSEPLSSYIRFFLTGLLNHGQTGGLVPSQRFLADKMIAPIPADYTGAILELGAGTGAFTIRLARKCKAARIIACEVNPTLKKYLRANLDRAGFNGEVQVICQPAGELLERMRCTGELVDYILSGIPLGNLDKEQSLALIDKIRGALKPGGMYIQFQHSLLDRKKIGSRFARLRTVPAFLNLPPAFVYYACK